MIGLPLHEGAVHLRAGIESILDQTFTDFSLLISDNGSSDDSVEIAREYARRDSRISVVAHQVNRGAAWNFNYVARQCQSPFFKWAAHDDLLAPDFLRACIDALEERPDGFLSFSRYRNLDSEGRLSAPEADWYWPHRLCDDDPARRFEDSMIDFVGCRYIFGVHRMESLARSPLIRPFAGSDRGLLTRLMLRGPLVEVPRQLFFSRRDDSCSTRLFHDDMQAYSEWFDPRNAGRATFPRTRLWLMDLNSILSAPIPWVKKRDCLDILWERTVHDPYMGPQLKEDLRSGCLRLLGRDRS
jgi:glycosyltransferase involved in cell wall biosynthesis